MPMDPAKLRLARQARQRLAHQRIETPALGLGEASQDFAAHARIPGAPQMSSDFGDSVFLIACRGEKRADLIGHGDEFRAVHAPIRLATSTAVTLYSGQLVAQSEFSVVMRFAPDSGK